MRSGYSVNGSIAPLTLLLNLALTGDTVAAERTKSDADGMIDAFPREHRMTRL